MTWLISVEVKDSKLASVMDTLYGLGELSIKRLGKKGAKGKKGGMSGMETVYDLIKSRTRTTSRQIYDHIESCGFARTSGHQYIQRLLEEKRIKRAGKGIFMIEGGK